MRTEGALLALLLGAGPTSADMLQPVVCVSQTAADETLVSGVPVVWLGDTQDDRELWLAFATLDEDGRWQLWASAGNGNVCMVSQGNDLRTSPVMEDRKP